MVGAYYFTENDAEPLTVLVPGAGVSNLNSGKIVDESEALYGQAEYHFTPKLSAIAGLRYTHESKDYSQWNSWVGRGRTVLSAALRGRAHALLERLDTQVRRQLLPRKTTC